MTTSSNDAAWVSPSRPAGWAKDLPSWASEGFEERVRGVADYIGLPGEPFTVAANALDASLLGLEAFARELGTDGELGYEPLADWERELLGLDEAQDADPINHPTHYAAGWSNGAEVIDITENLNFSRGNAVKYLARAGRKNPETEIEDLKKAAWYVQREINRLVWA